jgi:ABC-type nitrate/sulfonate/bicarbonate transport system substrate-binding protein
MKITKSVCLMVVLFGVMLFVPGPAAAVEKVTLAYAPSLSFAPLFIAIEKNYFKEQGVEVELKRFKSKKRRPGPPSGA